MRQKTRQELLQKIEDLEHECNLHRQEKKKHDSKDNCLQEILNNIPAPIYLKEVQGSYLLINKKYEELAHVSLADIVGKNDFDIFPEPVATLFRSQDEKVIDKNIPIEFEETIPLADGIHTFITSKFPLHGKDGVISAVGGFCTDITERKQAESEKEKLIVELQKALNEVDLLSGLLPICSSCRQIRDDKGYWQKIEHYLSKYSSVEFTHGICPKCAQKLYPEFYEGEDEK